MKEIVMAKNLTFSYGGNEVVSDVSFSVEKGDYVALMGHNGSGKSTLIKLLLGIIERTSGEISLFGENLSQFRRWKKIGYLPQNITSSNPLFPATVAEVVGLGLVRPNEGKIKMALEQMDILPLAKKLIGELSGGQIQRTLLARAIVNEPELLILDEPVSSVDATTREEFFAYAARLNKEKETTILLVTHDIGHSVKYTNKLLFLDKKVLFYGDYHQFCVSPQMNHQFGGELQHLMCGQH